MKILFDFGWHFIDIETCQWGMTPLLQFCSGDDYGYYKDGMAFLLQRGANVYAVDGNGNSCLHIALRGARGPSRFNEEFEALVLLVRAGADVHKKDNSGRSVSQTAYHRPRLTTGVEILAAIWGTFGTACWPFVVIKSPPSDDNIHEPNDTRKTILKRISRSCGKDDSICVLTGMRKMQCAKERSTVAQRRAASQPQTRKTEAQVLISSGMATDLKRIETTRIRKPLALRLNSRRSSLDR
jgi:Ankyrin repeats (many copies)